MEEETGGLKCPKCGKKLKRFSCTPCEYINWKELKLDAAVNNIKKERLKKASKAFVENFDKTMLNFALDILKERTRVIVKELIDLFEEEGYFEDLEATQIIDKDGLPYKIYKDWAIKYTIKIAKIWHKNKDVFIGTRQIKGHPYEIYLPEAKERFIENLKEGIVYDISTENILMPFGKFKGQSIKWIAELEPGYITWLYEKADLREGVLKKAVEICYMAIIKPKEMGNDL